MMGTSVRGAQRTINAREFAEWIAYWKIHPAGEGDDRRTAQICAVVANASPRRKQDHKFTAQEFMPKRISHHIGGRRPHKMSNEQIWAALAPLRKVAEKRS